jgi:hypothetical protein
MERSSVEDQREMLLVVAHEKERPLKQDADETAPVFEWSPL